MNDTLPHPEIKHAAFDRAEQLTHLLRLTGKRRIFVQEFPTQHNVIVDGTLDAIQGAIAELESPTSTAIFFGINPIKPGTRKAPGNNDIERRTHLFLDVDHPDKHTKLSATAEGKQSAFAVFLEISAYLQFQGWPAPTRIDSGNGPHAYWPIDLPNDADAATLVKSFLQALHDLFGPLVDTANADARRLGRVPGTWNRRGEHSAERPHRPCLFLEHGEQRVVTAPMIQAAIDKIKRELADECARSAARENLPGADYNRRANWKDILQPVNWKIAKETKKEIHWTREGKDRGTSATTGYCESEKSGDLLYVFSSNAAPFEANKAYSKFAAYTLLNHAGDFSAAARALTAKGYGGQNGYHHANGKSHVNGTHAAPAQKDDQEKHLTDLGNARRVVERHGPDLHYCYPLKTFFVFGGTHWPEDQTGEIVRRVKETQGSLYKWAAGKIADLGNVGEADSAERKAAFAKLMKVLQHALKWEAAPRIAASIELMKSEPGLPVLPDQFNRDHYLLNCLNGTIDLQTGILRPHRREDLINKIIDVHFDPDAKAPSWERALNTWMNTDASMIGYLRRSIGYCLTGDCSEQILWFLYGRGQNGKSTFLKVILWILGDYGLQAVSDLLLQKRNETHPTERADLYGKRFVATIETDHGKVIAEALVKQLTGSDRIRARRMYQDFFEFDPTHKIFLAANYKPTIQGTDKAIWRRIKLVPFNVTISENAKDKHLDERLKAELPGILAWAVRGCVEWQQDGLQEPVEVTEATAAYRAEQDQLATFVAEICTVHPNAMVKASVLFQAYQAWSGDKVTTANQFRQRIAERGFELKTGNGNSRFWHGIGIFPANAAQSGATDDAIAAAAENGDPMAQAEIKHRAALEARRRAES